MSIRVSTYLENKALSVLGLAKAMSPTEEEKFAFVNDYQEIADNELAEYDVWYGGSGDELLRFYNFQERVEYFTEIYYYKNKRSYFWSVASQERDVKRTHSGLPRAIVDTLVCMNGTPAVLSYQNDSAVEDESSHDLNQSLKRMKFWKMYRQTQMPLTYVDGWGAYKIAWNLAVDPEPAIIYYRAKDVRVYRSMGRVVGMTFLNWYTDGDKKWLVAETRVKAKDGALSYIDCFNAVGESLSSCPASDVPFIGGGLTEEPQPLPDLLAVPCSFFEDTRLGREGRSLFEGKIDLFDDADQTLSMATNTARRSMPIEQFNLDFCERRKNGRPVKPNTFERRYIGIQGTGQMMGSGGGNAIAPVTVTQPALNADMYYQLFQMIMSTIIVGMMSPSMLGVSNSTQKEAAEALRERSKTTVFFRNSVNESESEILSELFGQFEACKEYLRTGIYDRAKYDFAIRYSEFDSASIEDRVDTVAKAISVGAMSPKMVVEQLYGSSISNEQRQEEVDFVSSRMQNEANQQMAQAMQGPMAIGVDENGMPIPMPVPEGEEMPPEMMGDMTPESGGLLGEITPEKGGVR